jgi:hypothetical protein
VQNAATARNVKKMRNLAQGLNHKLYSMSAAMRKYDARMDSERMAPLMKMLR